MNKHRACIIGLGRIASLFEDDEKRIHPCTHAGALVALEDVELVSGAARSEESALRFKNRWNLDRVYTDYVEMIENEKPDIIGLATNPESHMGIVERIAGMGIKGILCEKPIALSLEDADRMIAACKKNDVVLMVMHNRRFNSLYREAKRIIENGEIGIVNSVVGICQGCKPNKSWQSDFEGPLLHDATHLFDILRYLFGDVDYVQSAVEKDKPSSKVEDSAYSILHFRNGIYAMTMVNERTDYMRFELEIQGSKGKIVIATNEARLYKVFDSPYSSGFKELKEVEYPKAEGKAINPYMEAYSELIDAIDNGKATSSTAYDGREALDIIMAIYESEMKNQEKIELPLPSIESSLKRFNEIYKK